MKRNIVFEVKSDTYTFLIRKMYKYCKLLLLLDLIYVCLPLRITRLSVPAYPLRGHHVLLECMYDLENDVLYSVKWYRDHEEFYRYLPKYKPPQQSYRLEGVRVDINRSDAHSVYLHSVSLKSSGIYSCEVSAEAPSFASAHSEAIMDVVYLPREGPRITRHTSTNEDNVIILNCTSGRSYPAAQLAWYLNDIKVIDQNQLIEYPVSVSSHGLLSSSLGLRVHIDPESKSARARCTSTVTEYGSREAMLLVKSGALSSKSAQLFVVFTSILATHIKIFIS